MTKEIYTCDGFLDEGLVSHGEELSVHLERYEHGKSTGINRETELLCNIRSSLDEETFNIHAASVRICVYPKLKLNLKFYYRLDLMRALSGVCMADKKISLLVDRDVHYGKRPCSSRHKMKITELNEHQTDIVGRNSFRDVGKKYIHVTLELA